MDHKAFRHNVHALAPPGLVLASFALLSMNAASARTSAATIILLGSHLLLFMFVFVFMLIFDIVVRSKGINIAKVTVVCNGAIFNVIAIAIAIKDNSSECIDIATIVGKWCIVQR
jgi:hypothetical protein